MEQVISPEKNGLRNSRLFILVPVIAAFMVYPFLVSDYFIDIAFFSFRLIGPNARCCSASFDFPFS